MDNLRPGNVTGNTCTNNFELRTIVEKAVWTVGDLLKKHRMLVDVSLPLKIKLERRQRPCNLEGNHTEVL